MKNIKRKVPLSVFILCAYILCVFIFVGCKISDKTELEKTANEDHINLEWPVMIQGIEKSGMKYLISSGRYGEAGVHVTNLTLDSLMVEHYKYELRNQKKK